MIDIYRHLRVDDMKWVYNEGVLTDVDGDSGKGKEYGYFYTLIQYKNIDKGQSDSRQAAVYI
jgi:hypothetical protein